MSQVFRPTEPFVIVTAENGKTEIPAGTPLTRLHFFDGKFLRAADLSLEQAYVQALTHLSNQAGGSGVVHGLDTTLNGDEVVIGPGMAIDPQGRVLLIPGAEQRFRISELIPLTARLALPPRRRFIGPGSFEECVTTSETPAVRPTEGYNFYLITIGHAEALCGQEDVYGKICEEACATSTDRPYFREGVIVRAEPLHLRTSMPGSGVVVLQERHLRSRLASAIFAMEEMHVGSLISNAGLQNNAWCLGARLATGVGTRVPLAVVARRGTTTIFLDAWVARRERIENPPRRYWAARMEMRPWDVFLAHVLQFQCQLERLLDQPPDDGAPDDPCRDMRDAVRDAAATIGDLVGGIRRPLPRPRLDIVERPVPPELRASPVPLTRISDLHVRLDRLLKPIRLRRQTSFLIDGGIIELPSAGYLPVNPANIVNDQVLALLGRGVDLRFCIVTPDYVAHALEEAQHMDRISLLEGLEPGGRRPAVDILVPDGEIVKPVVPARGIGFEGELHVRPEVSVPAPAPAPAAPAEPLTPAIPIDVSDLRERIVFDRIDLGGLREHIVLEPFRPRPTANVVRVLGAGRAEHFETGGAAFHFAGTSEASHKLKITDFVKGLAAIGRDAPDDLKLLQKLPVEEISGPVGNVAPAMYMRANTIGGNAALFTTGLRAKFPGGIEELARPALADLPDFEAPTAPAEKRLVTVWTSMRADSNPFELGTDRSTRVDLNVTVGMPGRKASWVDYRVLGELTVSHLQRTGSITHLRGYIHSGFAHTQVVAEGAAPIDHHDTGNIGVFCDFDQALTQQKLTMRLRHGRLNGFRIEITWGGVPLQAHVEVAYERRRELAETILVTGTLLRNDAVLAAGHPRHALAVSAVNVTGALIKRPEFAAEAMGRLFPPAPPPPKEIQVRATRDWVLFHRRRTKSCAVVETVAPAPSRRYQVWQVEVPDAAAAEKIRTALLTNDTAQLPTLSPVTPVEFVAGVATLHSQPSDLRLDWHREPRGNILQYSMIASQGTLDGDLLARSRLAQVHNAVQPPPLNIDRQAASDVLPFVPGPLTVPETDGAILLVTRTEAKTTCHNVYRVAPQFQHMALDLARDHQIVGLASNGRIATLIGRLDFNGDSAQFSNASGPGERQQVLSNWNAAGDGRIGRVLGFANAGDPVASGEPRLTDRVKAIAALLGNRDGVITASAVSAQMPEGCEGATFVIPIITTQRVVAIDRNLSGVSPSVPTMLSNGQLGGILKYAKPLGELPFVGGTGTQLTSAPLQLVASVFPGATATEAFTYSLPGGAPEGPLVLQAQGAVITNRAGVTGIPVTVPNVTATGWPDAKYQHVTVIAVQSAALTPHLVVAIDQNITNTDPTIPQAIQNGHLGTILKYGRILGDAVFRSGTADVPAPLTLHTLAAAFPNAVIVSAKLTIYTQPGATPEPENTLKGQVGAIGAAVGAAGAPLEISAAAPTGWPTPGVLHVTVIAISQRPGMTTFVPIGGGRIDGRVTLDELIELDPGVVDRIFGPGGVSGGEEGRITIRNIPFGSRTPVPDAEPAGTSTPRPPVIERRKRKRKKPKPIDR